MSVTLMRLNKEGKRVPLKLSIWDAFKGVPVPKPRLHQCNGCGQFHRPGCKPKEKPATEKQDTKKGDDEQTDGSEFTVAEDAKIREIKAETPTCAWDVVAEALGGKHHKNACRARYKELQDADKKGDTEGTTNEAKTNNVKGKKGGKSEEKHNDDSTAKDLTKKQAKAARKQEQGSGTKNEKTASSAEAATPVEEVKPTPASANDRQKWAAAAAKHFDRTGQRIAPEQARKMAEETT